MPSHCNALSTLCNLAGLAILGLCAVLLKAASLVRPQNGRAFCSAKLKHFALRAESGWLACREAEAQALKDLQAAKAEWDRLKQLEDEQARAVAAAAKRLQDLQGQHKPASQCAHLPIPFLALYVCLCDCVCACMLPFSCACPCLLKT